MTDEQSPPRPATSNEDALVVQSRLLTAAGINVAHIVDGGAFEGELTARFLDFFPSAHIWAFEPTPVQVDVLRARFEHEARVTVVPAALGAGEGSKAFGLNDNSATN